MEDNNLLTLDNLEMDLRAHTVKRGGKEIQLSPMEFRFLEYLLRNPGAALTRLDILEHVWDVDVDPFTNTIDVHISFLRRKIDNPWKKKLIKTVSGHGYKIEA